MAIRQPAGLGLVDALGTAPRRSIAIDGLIDFACVGSNLWVVTDSALRQFSLDSGNPSGDDTSHGFEHGRLVPAPGEGANTALLLGYQRLLLREENKRVTITDVTDLASPTAFVTLLGGRRLLIVESQSLRMRDVGRDDDLVNAPLPVLGQAVFGQTLFGGRALVLLIEAGEQDAFLVLRSNGSLVHNVSLPRTRLCALADARGLALVHDPEADMLLSVDLRYGKLLGRAGLPLPAQDLAIDADGKYLVLAGFNPEPRSPAPPGADGDDDGDEMVSLAALHVPYTELYGGGQLGGTAPRKPMPPPVDARETSGGDSPGAAEASQRRTLVERRIPSHVDAADGAPVQPSREEEEQAQAAPAAPEPILIPEGQLLGLGRSHAPLRAKAPPGVKSYGSPREHLDELLDLVAARAARAIAQAWDSGRLSLPSEDLRPFEREVHALVGIRPSMAPDALAEAEERLAQLTSSAGRRALASLAAGMSLPFVDIARDFDLATTEAQVLLVAAAPALRGEIARLYGVLANDENRPICDRFLIELILGGDDRATRDAVARALAADSPLVKHGLIKMGQPANDQYLFVPIHVDQTLLMRLRGHRFSGTGPTDPTTIRFADRSLADIVMPDELKRDLVLELLRPSRDGRPHRVLLRGRLGTGRRTLAAALAARNNKPLACIDCERLPRTGRAFADALRTELRRAGLRGAIPCVSGLEVVDSADAEGIEHVRAAIRSYPAPLFVRTSPEFRPPLEPGYSSFVLRALSESERYEFWTQALERRGLVAAGAERLASRFRIGPGTIESVLSTVDSRLEDADKAKDITERLDIAARQYIETRMGNVATHVTRTARWEQVALPDDVLDSVREFIGRVSHRRKVYESWGFDARMSSARGLTALFYGPPGTGKSMVAGLIARELNLDLYRVDLARITSKWIGETEKNLAEVFDAGEDGQAVILFDEADSLFAKRTEVKSSVDRYANLEVNYLLQRLDTFEGVAILTTNMEGSIDNAFKRRMSLRLAFPFPDEEMRVRLWSAHLPPEVPTVGDFDFADLAKRFPMSGGYIRNSSLRAAFLAAQEDRSLSQEHLERAIHLEYREMGKLASSGRLE